MKTIYLDHAATTPIHPDVIQAMIPVMEANFGNPSSIHQVGRQARMVVDEAREKVAADLKVKANEIIFTSGGTEADNLALIGAAMANQSKGKHMITTTIEHHGILHTCRYLESQGFTVTYLPVNENGLISVSELEKALTDETILVSIMYGNNEVGVIQPIKEIGKLLEDKDIIFHSDAVQAYGMVDLEIEESRLDLVSISSHKINGPKGMGCLVARQGVSISPTLFGGEQERKRRAGTENVPAIVGFAKASKIAHETMTAKQGQYEKFKEMMIEIFEQEGIHFDINAGHVHTLPHIFNVYFPGTNVESFLVNLDLAGIAASSGSACTAGSIDPSHVLVAMFGKASERIQSSIRFSFGLGNTNEEVEIAAKEITKIVKRLVK